MRVRVQGVAALVVALAGIGCGAPPATKTAPPAQAPATQAPAAQAPAPGAGTAAVVTGTSEFGVPECDRYLKNYQACLDGKIPEASRAGLKMSLDQARTAWKQTAATPEGKAALVQMCTQAEATAKQALAPYGCTW
jgi:hypothetical protein